MPVIILLYYGTGAATVYQQRLGEHRWSGAASGTAGNTASMTQHMVIVFLWDTWASELVRQIHFRLHIGSDYW